MVDLSKLKSLFPYGSKDFIEANADAGLQDSKLKQASRSSLVQVLPGKEKSYGRSYVCLTAFTVRPRDQDNLGCGCKGLLDAIKGLGLIPDDDPYSIELTLKQRHVDHFDQEKTLLEIEYR